MIARSQSVYKSVIFLASRSFCLWTCCVSFGVGAQEKYLCVCEDYFFGDTDILIESRNKVSRSNCSIRKMPVYPVKGEITSTITSTNDIADIEWKIPKFFSFVEYEDEIWESPSFLFLNAEWCLRITLKVDGILNSYKVLNLVVQNPYLCYSVTSAFGIKRLSRPCNFQPVTSNFDKKSPANGIVDFYKSHLERINASDDFLLVYCNAAGSSSRKTFLNSTHILYRNFQDLLLSGRNSDLTIAVRDQEFKAHKIILETRSPVFAAMFEHDMTEKVESVVKVEDCDPYTFQNFLQCVYAGRIEDLSVDKAIRLYIVSHKYTVIDIMDECVQLMKSEMSEDTVCDILTLANMYNEPDLKASAQDYMAQNINNIFPTSNWNALMNGNSLLHKYS